MTIKQFLKTPIKDLLNWSFMYNLACTEVEDNFLHALEESPNLDNITLGMVISAGESVEVLMKEGEEAFK